MQNCSASKRQCGVLHVGSIWYWEYSSFKWLIDWCAIAIQLSITLLLHWIRPPDSKQLQILIFMTGLCFFFNVSFSCCLCTLSSRVSCECQDNLQFDSFILQSMKVVIHAIVIHPSFLIFAARLVPTTADGNIWYLSKHVRILFCNVFLNIFQNIATCLNIRWKGGGNSRVRDTTQEHRPDANSPIEYSCLQVRTAWHEATCDSKKKPSVSSHDYTVLQLCSPLSCVLLSLQPC